MPWGARPNKKTHNKQTKQKTNKTTPQTREHNKQTKQQTNKTLAIGDA
jgi:hypothetical protein